MTTAEFHNTIYLHGPHRPDVHWVESEDGGWVSVETSGASILVKTRSEASALIRAFLEAEGMLPADPPSGGA